MERYESFGGDTRSAGRDQELRESVFFLANAFPKFTRNIGDKQSKSSEGG